MKKNNKKGFTIVELVIVIAVIAILAAVLIPTFSSIIKKAKVNNDIQLVRNLNTALATDNKKHVTMQSALDSAAKFGYDVAKINASATDNEILWDSKNDVFCYLNTEKNALEYIPSSVADDAKLSVNSYLLWKISDAVDEIYSTYYTGKETRINTSKGFDAGTTTGITEINYTNRSGSAQDVVIRTNGGSLTINDTNNDSHQYHYGSSANVTVATGTSCYECHAIVAAMKITEGKVIADRGAYVGIVEASSSVILKEENGGVFVIPTNVSADKVPAAVASQIKYTVDGGKFVASSEKVNKSYYVITSYEDLTNFVDKWNSGFFPTSANVKFANNVTIKLDAAEAWTPIGNWEHPFNGIFDGNGCVISGLTADATHQNYKHIFAENASVGDGETYGFFGIVGGGDTLIKNLTLKDVNIDLSSAKNVGALIGYVPDNRKFQDTRVTTKWKTDSEIGTHKVTISGVSVTGSVSAEAHVSGIVGKIYSTGDITITDCHNKANVTGKNGFIGGIVGIQSGYDDRDPNNTKEYKLTISDCTNEGNITLNGNSHSACGIIGRVNDQYQKRCVAVISNSSNKGIIHATDQNKKFEIAYVEHVKSATINGVTVK